MPSIMTLEGLRNNSGRDKSTRKQAQLFGDLGETALMTWMKGQNIVVAGAVALGLSLAVGFAVSHVFIWGLDKFKGR